MHETYLAQCILEKARSSLPPECRPEDVRTVGVRVGKLDAVELSFLSFMFDALKPDFQLNGAALVLSEEDVSCTCRQCGATTTFFEPIFVCPQCGSGSLKLITGRGITLTELTVSE